MFIVGSHAMAFYASTAMRQPGDLDVQMTLDEFVNFTTIHSLKAIPTSDGHYIINDAPEYGHIEIEIIEPGSSNELYERWIATCNLRICLRRIYTTLATIAPPPVLYSIKRSHRFYPHMFDKHIWDYHLLKEMVGGVDILHEITDIRERETKARYGALKTPSLMKSPTDFFNDNVSNRTFVHDDIHTVMAHCEKPMYSYYQPDSNSVKCDKGMFFAMPFEHQIQGVLEEAYVIALERGVIPMMFQGDRYVDPQAAFCWAFMRICTTLTSGWFRNFAVENYPAIREAQDKNFVQKFLSAVDEGKIHQV